MIGYFMTVACALLGLSSAGPLDDIVYSLPGLDLNGMGTKLWSGYIPIPQSSKQIHYLLVESQNDPVNDPLIIWYNGGPGCSSMLGFMQEHGPFSWENGATKWNEGKNPYSWNREANVLYIEQPAGVGYSYIEDKKEMDFNFTDYNAAQDNLQAVLGWYDKFPEFKSNDLYISGESYAGVYVPYLLFLMHNYIQTNLDNPDAFLPPLKGMMVGNGVTNWKYDGSPAAFEMSYWHSLVDKDMYDLKHQYKCPFNELIEPTAGVCNDTFNKFQTLWDGNLNIYDIFGECYNEPEMDRGLRSASQGEISPRKDYWTAADYTPWRFKNKNKQTYQLGELPPCTFGGPIVKYLNDPEVMNALNIPENIPRFNTTTKTWDLCRSGYDGFNYESGLQASQWIWESMKGKYRFLKYSGDTDAAVPTTGTRWWIDELNLDILEDWRPYLVENESGEGKTLGGYVIEYNGLTLGTVHGAGHMAPQFKPKETYHLIFNWLFQRGI